MPRRKITFARTDVQAMWTLLVSIGEEPVSVKLHKDGTFRIMTKKHAEITKALSEEGSNSGFWDKACENVTP